MTRALLMSPLIALGLSIATPSLARADGWWEVTCNSDGHEGSGGCTNPDNMSGCTCETGSDARHAASAGGLLAVFGFVAFRIGRKRRR
ncbi:MAG TPA: hypothetical protein VIV11_33795 [Kofleriaceae bacterium]